jgi:hypothetical protein
MFLPVTMPLKAEARVDFGFSKGGCPFNYRPFNYPFNSF